MGREIQGGCEMFRIWSIFKVARDGLKNILVSLRHFEKKP